MENTISELPYFPPISLTRGKSESAQTFRDRINKHAENLIEKGYHIEIKLMNEIGGLCEDEQEMVAVATCKIIPTDPKDVTKDVGKDWVAVERAKEEKRKKDMGNER